MDQGLVKTAVSAGLLREEWPEYRLVIPAEEPVSRQLKQLRKEWETAYGARSVSDKPPSITVACFEAREEMEDILIRWIQKICDHQTSFLVTLNNFSAIPPQVVYVRVQEEAPFQKIAAQLRTLEAFMKKDNGRKAKIFEKPFIKLGSFPKGTSQKDWFHYSHQLFHAAFEARKLVLFRQEKGNWKMVSVFPFKITR
jgi:2'-5' RNA ligase